MNAAERTFDDLLNDSEVKDFLHRATVEMFPKMQGSAMSMVISSSKPDAKLALEVGAAVLFDKPIVVVARIGHVIPQGLRRIAHAVVEVDDFVSPASAMKIQQAIEFVLSAQEVASIAPVVSPEKKDATVQTSKERI